MEKDIDRAFDIIKKEIWQGNLFDSIFNAALEKLGDKKLVLTEFVGYLSNEDAEKFKKEFENIS